MRSSRTPCRARSSARWTDASGTPATRAARTACASAGLVRATKRSSPSPSSVAAMTALRCRSSIREPATSAATFVSSTTFQRTYCSMSGWSRSSVTIFAARRVVPPDLIAPAARSPILRKLMRPDERPPPERRSSAPRMAEKLEPVPEPYLKTRASRVHRSMMPPSFTRSSATDWMKQACGAGRS